MAEFKDPGPRERKGVLLEAARMARANPGRWVMANAYKDDRSATSVATQYRRKYPELEITTRENELFMRFPEVETK